MTGISYEARVITAIRSNVPAADDLLYDIGDEVLMYREKPVPKWTGPFVIREKKGKMITLGSGDRCFRASVDKVKHYHSRNQETSLSAGAHVNSSGPAGHKEKGRGDAVIPALHDERGVILQVETSIATPDTFQPTTEVKDDEEDLLQILEGFREDERTRQKISDALDAEYPNDIFLIKVKITEVLKPGDPRGKTKTFLEAKKNEVMGFKEKN